MRLRTTYFVGQVRPGQICEIENVHIRQWICFVEACNISVWENTIISHGSVVGKDTSEQDAFTLLNRTGGRIAAADELRGPRPLPRCKGVASAPPNLCGNLELGFAQWQTDGLSKMD